MTAGTIPADTFGAQLRSWRLARRVSQEQLALAGALDAVLRAL